MKGKGMITGARREKTAAPKDAGLEAAARVLAGGGRVPKKFAVAAAAAQAAEGVKARPAGAGPRLGEAEAWAKVSAARRAAYAVLMGVEAGEGHSDELLHGEATEGLSEADRNLATALVMGVLRWQIALDATVNGLLQRPDQRLAEEVRMALRLGAFQLQHMDRIPAHAALSESVEMCRAAGHGHASGMVNAVLRKVSATKRAGSKIFETTAAFAERLGHPLWLVERWVKAFGRDAAVKICEADQEEPVGGRLFGASDEGLPVVDDGSRLVAEIAAAAAPWVDGRTVRVWDCCAAPGGKTLVIAKRLAGAEIVATDVSRKRMGQMEARLRRFGYAAGVKCEVADAGALRDGLGEFDLVLCDVPCSGTGTLGRNPEIRLRLTVAEIERQAVRQKDLLAAAMQRVTAGGRLVYSTCSLEVEENERVVLAVVGEGWRRIGVEELAVSGVELGEMVRDGALRTLPGVHPCDGFYAVVLERV